jgi:hypothetical protein
MKANRTSILLIAITVLLVSGCAIFRPQNNAIPRRIVAISQFQCDCDPVHLEQIRDVNRPGFSGDLVT